VAERQVFEFGLHPIDPKTMRDGGVNIEGLLGNQPPLLLPQWLKRSHIMESISQLDQDHPNIFRHRQHHLPKTFGLVLQATAEGEFTDLRQAVYKIADLVAKGLFDLLQRRMGIFYDIVQQRGGDARHIHLHIQDDLSDGQRVR
jgi:hypothetical protein